MTAGDIISELSTLGVTVVCLEPGRVRLTVESGDVPPEAVALARDNKPVLLAHFRPSCTPHNNPNNYIDTPATNRQRTGRAGFNRHAAFAVA
ncbi:MAG: hypothetical protein OSA98_19360 [Rubripirellula sp.]|nr:hypothetical protein [Rubripirellula sp.]